MDAVLQKYTQWLADAKVEKALLTQQAEELEEKVSILQEDVNTYSKARWVLSEVTRLTQERIKEYIESLTTMAIRAVFGGDFEFLVDFKISRNKSECFFFLKKDGYEYVPKDDEGGGLLDVTSVVLRIVLYSLEKPRKRNVIILDEPFRFLGRLTSKAGEMVKEVSKRVGMQIIMITHESELADLGDKSFLVEKVDGISKVTVVEEPMAYRSGELKRRLKRRKKEKPGDKKDKYG